MKNKIFYWLLSAVLILLSFLYLSYLTANNPLDSEENNIEIKFTNLLPTTLINKKPDLLKEYGCINFIIKEKSEVLNFENKKAYFDS